MRRLSSFFLLLLLFFVLRLQTETLVQQNSQPVDNQNQDDELFWGSYKSNLYFGMKNRVPQTKKSKSTDKIDSQTISGVEFSVGWFDATDPTAGWEKLRYATQQSQLRSYGWLKHDGRTFGIQEFIDTEIGVNITISFMKFFPLSSSSSTTWRGSKYTLPVSDQTWSVHVSVEPLNGFEGSPTKAAQEKAVSLLLYFVNTDLQNGNLKISSGKKKKGLIDNPLVVQGHNTVLDSFEFHVVEPETNTAPQYSDIQTRIMKNLLPDLSNTHFLGENLGRSTSTSTTNRERDSKQNQKARVELHTIDERGKGVFVNKMMGELRAAFMNGRQSGLSQFNTLLVPTLSNTIDENSNTLTLQKVRTPPFYVDIIYTPKSLATKEGQPLTPTMKKALVDKLTGPFYHSELSRRVSSFDERFSSIFPLSATSPSFPLPEQQASSKQQKGGNDSEQVDENSLIEILGGKSQVSEEDVKKFIMSTFSSLIGGIGYFEGRGLVQLEGMESERETSVERLYSAVPSRSFFPRGFFWDEGFHQSQIYHWDPSISIEALTHWYNLMFPSGWIPREQILGLEARARVPPEFQVQSDHIGNPPTFMLVINKMIETIQNCRNKDSVKKNNEHVIKSGDVDLDIISSSESGYLNQREKENQRECGKLESEFLTNIFDKVSKHFDWFITTHQAQRPNTFRWKDRKQNHTLSSGFDDFPRVNSNSAETNFEKEEHIDILSWIVFGCQTLLKVSQTLHLSHHPSLIKYSSLQQVLLQKIEQEYWDEEFEFYTDLISTDSSLVHVRHYGYVGLMPLALGLVPKDSPHLLKILNSLQHSRLMSQYGVRSLSVDDSFFGKGENYWRGPIWININYLILSSLYKNYMSKDCPGQLHASIIYHRLRASLIRNMYSEWKRTGFIWEQYTASNGQGKGCRPFTGWSALVVNIIAEKY